MIGPGVGLSIDREALIDEVHRVKINASWRGGDAVDATIVDHLLQRYDIRARTADPDEGDAGLEDLALALDAKAEAARLGGEENRAVAYVDAAVMLRRRIGGGSVKAPGDDDGDLS